MQVIDVIVASTNDMGPYSLDSFRKNNLSASWQVVGVDTSIVTNSEVRMFVLPLLEFFAVGYPFQIFTLENVNFAAAHSLMRLLLFFLLQR